MCRARQGAKTRPAGFVGDDGEEGGGQKKLRGVKSRVGSLIRHLRVKLPPTHMHRHNLIHTHKHIHNVTQFKSHFVHRC